MGWTPVRLEVYDISGRQVATLVDEPLGPGHHTAVWTGTDQSGRSVASGIYFYMIETSDYRMTKKMTLLK